MRRRKGLTLIELIVAVLIIIMLLLILIAPLNRTKSVFLRTLCENKLKSIGSSMIMYANDHDARFPQLPGNGPWSKELGFEYDNPAPDFAGAQAGTPRTITASWYLLVRYADVTPISMICPESDQDGFDGENPKNLEINKLWDFGENPYRHVSYAMHSPYGKFPANKKLSSNFAIAADMNPWFRYGDTLPKGENDNAPQILNTMNKKMWVKANSQNHNTTSNDFTSVQYKYPGQNVLYADGHNTYEKTSNVGVNQDNIYTYWSRDKEPTEQDIQGGTAPTNRDSENDAKSKDDSFLAI